MDINIIGITKNEESILQTLWRENRALSRSEIINLTRDREWKENSFYGLLNSLIDRGIIKVDSIVKTGKNFGRAYIPRISEKDYNLLKLEINIDFSKLDKSIFLKYMGNMVEAEKFSENDLKKLEEILKNKLDK